MGGRNCMISVYLLDLKCVRGLECGKYLLFVKLLEGCGLVGEMVTMIFPLVLW